MVHDDAGAEARGRAERSDDGVASSTETTDSKEALEETWEGPRPDESSVDPTRTSGAVPIAPFTGSDRFLVQRRLGIGAFGVVYEAYDRRRHALVALKVLRAASAEALYRFKKGFRSLAHLRHPNLVSFHELFTEEGAWYFSMELIDGVDLLSALCPDGGPARDLGRVRRVMHQLAEGLQAVHAAGMMHRDIKPPNVLVTADDHVKLLDFGLVGELRRDRSGDARPPSSPSPRGSSSDRSRLVGTPAYMAPEIAEDGEPSTAGDWYAVGVMLWQVLVGALPFDGSLLEILLQKRQGVAAGAMRLAAARAGIDPPPDDLEELCHGLLEPTPERRLDGAAVLRCLRAPGERSSPRRAASGVVEDAADTDGERAPTTADVVPAKDAGSKKVGSKRVGSKKVGSKRVGSKEVGSKKVGSEGAASEDVDSAESAVPASVSDSTETETRLFVGRREALETLHDAAAASRGRPVMVGVHGPSGIGKTALVEHFVDDLLETEPTATVLTGRCFVQEAVPYKALDDLVDALSRPLDDLPASAFDTLDSGPAAALVRLFPVLRRIEGVAEAADRDDAVTAPEPSTARRQAIDALRHLLGALAAQGPLVLTIDDLQWGDLDSFALLDGLFDASPPLLFLATWRDGDDGSAFLRALHDARAAGEGRWGGAEVREIALDRLDPDEARELLRRTLESRAPLDALIREGEGSPLYLVELARAAPDAGHGLKLTQLLRARIDRLEPSARRLLETVAIAGRPVATAAAARAAALGEDQAPALGALRAARLVRLDAPGGGERLEPYHDRVREAALHGVDEASRRALHGRLAHALEAVGDADPETLASHFQASAEEDARAFGYAVRAAERAERALAFDRAARLYRLALELMPAEAPDRYELRLRLGRALADAGRSRAAADTFLRAVGESGRLDPFEAQRQAAEQLLVSGHVDRGLVVLRHVLRTVDLSFAERGWRSLIRLWLLRLRLRWRSARFVERSEDEIPREMLRRIDVCWSAEVGLCLVDLMRASEFHARHLLLALRAGEPQRVARGLAMEVFFGSLEGGDSEEALRRARALAGRVEGRYASSLTEMASGMLSCSKGRWTEASRQLARAEAYLRENRRGIAWELDTVRQFRAIAWLHAGRWRELFAELPDLLAQARDAEDLFLELHLKHWVESLRRVADDQPEAAAEALRGAAGSQDDPSESVDGLDASAPDAGDQGQGSFYFQHFGLLVAETRIALYRGDGARAFERVEASWPGLTASFLQRIEMILVQSHDLRGRAALAAALAAARDSEPGRRQDLLAAVEEEARALTRASSTWARALAAGLRAGVAQLEGEVDRALDEMEVARSGFEACEMAVHAASARRRLAELRDDRAERDAADEELGRFGIRRPHRMVRVLFPIEKADAR